MKTFYGIPGNIIAEITCVLKENPKIQKAVLYGSRAKGNFREGSNIDIVLYGKDLTFDDGLDILTKLEENTFPYIFDVQIAYMIKDIEILEHINRVGIDIYIRDSADILE